MSKMLDEIREQPAALERTLRGGLPTATTLARRIALERPQLVLLAARGTSDNAAQFARYLLEIATGIPVSLAAPSIFTLYRARVDLRNAMVVAISQSGESTDTNLVLERAREQGALTVAVTNEPRSSLARLADHVFLVRAGRERSVAATKTYTGQLLMCYLLAHALGARFRLDDLWRIPEWVSAALTLEPEISARAERYRFLERAIVVGRGLNYANAFELALKLMETCYVQADRFSAADFLHGPIAMVEPSFPLFVFAPRGPTWPGIRDMIGKLDALGAETLLFTDASHREAAARKLAVVLPVKLARHRAIAEELYTPIPYIVPAQLFAALLAERKGLDPDRPRSLTKITRTL
ncbi:MAG TPA: SIS domain-containing protein [Bryobacteraceae bacterium]|nr:SIS domain-containing protein [Bryobacteraceae bacterium]